MDEREAPAIREVPDTVQGYTKKVFFGCGNLYLTINFDEKRCPVLVLAQLGKTGCCQRALLDALLRGINRQLEYGIDLDEIVHDLVGIRCDQGIAGAGRLSCADAIGNELKAYLTQEKS